LLSRDRVSNSDVKSQENTLGASRQRENATAGLFHRLDVAMVGKKILAMKEEDALRGRQDRLPGSADKVLNA